MPSSQRVRIQNGTACAFHAEKKQASEDSQNVRVSDYSSEAPVPAPATPVPTGRALSCRLGSASGRLEQPAVLYGDSRGYCTT